MTTELSMARGGRGSAVINFDPTTNDAQIRFDFGLKNVETSSLTERELNFKTSVFQRTVGFGVGYRRSDGRLASHGELHWDADEQPEFAFDFNVGRTSHQPAYDGRLKVSSYLFNTDSTMSHRLVGDGHYVSEVVLDLSERLTLRSDLNLASSPITHRITVQHPRLSRVCSLLASSISCLSCDHTDYPSVCPSFCPVRAPNSKTKKA